MDHRLRALLFVVCLLWQPLSALLPAALDERANAIAHGVVHGKAVDHHHHDDASLHLGESDEAGGTAHQHVLDGGQPPGLIVNLASPDDAAPATRVRLEPMSLPESAVLEGPLRPPRHARG